MQYTEGKTSLDKMVSSFKLKDTKGFSPYAMLESPDLETKELFMTLDQYDLFKDNLHCHVDHMQGNLLEAEWVSFAKTLPRKNNKCAVQHLARVFAAQTILMEHYNEDTEDSPEPFNAVDTNIDIAKNMENHNDSYIRKDFKFQEAEWQVFLIRTVLWADQFFSGFASRGWLLQEFS